MLLDLDFLRAVPERDFARDFAGLRLFAPVLVGALAVDFLGTGFFLKLGSTRFLVIFRAIYAPEPVLGSYSSGRNLYVVI